MALHQFERTAIDLLARLSRCIGDGCDRVLERRLAKRAPEQVVDVLAARRLSFVGGRDQQYELAARLGVARVVLRKRRQRVTAHLLMQLGELAADRGLARADDGGEICE